MRYWLETLGCPKNQVDSDKLAGTLQAEGYVAASRAGGGRPGRRQHLCLHRGRPQESIDTILALADARRPGARLVVTGCLAERYGDELAEALPEVDLVAGFGVPVDPGAPARPAEPAGPVVRPAQPAPPGRRRRRGPTSRWPKAATASAGSAPSRRFGAGSGPGPLADILAEVESLAVEEIVLVAQDLASYGRDLGSRRPAKRSRSSAWCEAVAARVARTRLLYLYPSELTDGLIDVMGATGCPYFDLSLQHVSRSHLRRMRRWGDGDRFLARIERIRAVYPDAALRSSFIVGYPGRDRGGPRPAAGVPGRSRTWTGPGSSLFPRRRAPTPPASRTRSPPDLAGERLAECAELQDAITARRRRDLVGRTLPGARRRAGRGPQPPGGARDRRRDPGAGLGAGRRAGSTSW